MVNLLCYKKIQNMNDTASLLVTGLGSLQGSCIPKTEILSEI